MTEVEYTETAVDHLSDLDPPVAERLVDKHDEAAAWPDHHPDSLTGYPYSVVRAGDYRAMVSWNRADGTILVEAVGHRRNVYDRHRPP